MSKYVIEIEEKPLCVFDKDTQTFFPRLWRVKGFNSLVFDKEGLSRLEELNSDYINEHFSDLQDTAYQKGLEEGKKATWGLVADASSAEYQRGLDDAWEAAKKIELDDGIDMNTLCTIFGYGCSDSIIRNYSASEAIEKLKAYEEKQKADDDIKAGDIVYLSGDKYIVSYINDDGCADLIHIWSGSTCARVSPDCLTRTGKHYDIDKILEAMKA